MTVCHKHHLPTGQTAPGLDRGFFNFLARLSVLKPITKVQLQILLSTRNRDLTLSEINSKHLKIIICLIMVLLLWVRVV